MPDIDPDAPGGLSPLNPAVKRELDERSRELLHLHMMRSIVTEPLLSRVQLAADEDRFDVIIALNEMYESGIDGALAFIKQRASDLGIAHFTNVSHYVFVCLTRAQILILAEESRKLTNAAGKRASAIYRIWEDTEVNVSLTQSVITVKADAAQRAFQARGERIVWAVLDSGIQGNHPHFRGTVPAPPRKFDSLAVEMPIIHTDFTPLGTTNPNSALEDQFGHGTHVAGIIAGYWESATLDGEEVMGTEMRNEANDQPMSVRGTLQSISGVAPLCSLVSLKVIADRNGNAQTRQTAGQGKVSWVLRAIDQIQQWNQYGKRLLIHGVNMSLGYDFDPRWFGCGQSPLCVEVNRLVKCGVAVVVAAGNGGYSSFINAMGKAESRYSELSITDPGNAELAVTVGSTHREMPHVYGVSYFSSRGPTGDGRLKPDLVAPGERIVSCAAGVEVAKYSAPGKSDVLYCEQTGTSMAAPHVSGAIAAFLSVRREFIGEPEKVKQLFLDNCTDLRRERLFQGAGLVDIMRVLQAV